MNAVPSSSRARIVAAGVAFTLFHAFGAAQQPAESRSAGQATAQAPSFSVVRVSLSPDSEAGDWGIGIRGQSFWAVHVTLDELICWAYQISPAQIDHAPDWMARERFDVDGRPEPGDGPRAAPEYRMMLRSALAERFALQLQPATKVLPVYVLSVDGRGLQVAQAQDEPAKASWGVHRGWLSITNMTFDSVASILQRTVFNRPVLNQTGLRDRYSFVLKWRADETQFTQMQGIEVPQETGTEDVEDIYTAARKQLGITIHSRKERTPVVVVARVSRPSPN